MTAYIYAHNAIPDDSPVRCWHCANCGAIASGYRAALPDMCPRCDDYTTWMDATPRRVLWRDQIELIEGDE